MYIPGIYLLITEPASTPIIDDRTSAHAEPIKTCNNELDLEAKSIVESCVLSPNSARKTRMKVEKIVFHINHTPKEINKQYIIFMP